MKIQIQIEDEIKDQIVKEDISWHINNAREMLGISLPFTTFDEFIGHLRQSLNSYKINTIADLEALKDGDHHISGNNQERITNYRNDTSVETVISCLALMCIEKLQGKKFIYNR